MAELNSTNLKFGAVALLAVGIAAAHFFAKVDWVPVIEGGFIIFGIVILVGAFFSWMRFDYDKGFSFDFGILTKYLVTLGTMLVVVKLLPLSIIHYQEYLFWTQYGIILVVETCLYLFIERFIAKREQEKSDKAHVQSQINSLKQDLEKSQFKYLENATATSNEISKLRHQFDKLKKPSELRSLFQKTISTLNVNLSKQEADENEKQERRELNNRLTFELLDYFKRKKSTENIPSEFTGCDESVISNATKLFETEQSKEKYDYHLQEEAKEHILEHRAFPSNFANFSDERKLAYEKAYADYKAGKLVSKHDVLKVDKKYFDKKFIFAKELTRDQRERFVKKYGFRMQFFGGFDGKGGENVLLRNDESNETNYHFCWKHMFGSLNKYNPELEKDIGQLRTDVAFNIHNKNVAIEIETGKNNKLQLERKVVWLNENFEFWCFVCTRNSKKKYREFVDRKKSFVFTTGEAYSWLALLYKR